MMSASKPAIVIRLRVLIWGCCCVRGFDLAGTGRCPFSRAKRICVDDPAMSPSDLEGMPRWLGDVTNRTVVRLPEHRKD